MTTSNNLRRRLDKLAGPPKPPSHAELQSALAALERSTVALCGRDRDAWVLRIASGNADADDKSLLRHLPADALKSVRMTPLRYVRMIGKMLTDY